MTDHNQRPDEISDAVLMAYLSGDVSEQLSQQIESDATLLARVRELGAWEALLNTGYQEINCPTPAELLLYQNQLLGSARHHQIKLHIVQSTDCSCAEELQELAAINTAPQQKKQDDNLWDRIRSAGKQIREAVELIELNRPVPAMRGDEPERRILRAGDYMIILMLTPPLTPEDTWELEGQITHKGEISPDIAGKAEIYDGDTLVTSDRVDDLGFFTMEGIPAGALHLLIETQTAAISPIGLEL